MANSSYTQNKDRYFAAIESVAAFKAVRGWWWLCLQDISTKLLNYSDFLSNLTAIQNECWPVVSSWSIQYFSTLKFKPLAIYGDSISKSPTVPSYSDKRSATYSLLGPLGKSSELSD